MHPYPPSWPTRDPKDPTALRSRITEDQKQDLYNRRVTTRALAAELNVHENYLSSQFPGKAPVKDPKKLIKARKEFRLEIARLVLTGKYNIKQAAATVHCSYNTMFRLVQQAKQIHPELVETFKTIVHHNRKTFNRTTC